MNNCQICGRPLKTIPAGVSKTTGKPYNSFMACEDRSHKQPRIATTPPQQPIYPFQPENRTTGANLASQAIIQPKPQADWDKISFGKCKHAFLGEAYKAYINKIDIRELPVIEKEAELWATMSMRRLNDRTDDEIFNEMAIKDIF